FFEGSLRCPKRSLLSCQCLVKRKRALQRCNSPRNSSICDAPKVLAARRRSKSAAGCFLGHPHVPEDFGHRSTAFKSSFSEVLPLRSPKSPRKYGNLASPCRFMASIHPPGRHYLFVPFLP